MVSKDAQNAIQMLLKEKQGVFEEIFESIILDFLTEIEGVLDRFCRECPTVQCRTDNILFHAGQTMRDLLIELCIRTLVGEIYEQKEHLVGDTAEQRYQYFLKELQENNCKKLFSKWPELGWLVKNRLDNTIFALAEFFERLKTDKFEIEQEFGITIKEICYVSIGEGDTHSHGKTVFILHCNDNVNVVYKPHSLYNDVLYSQVQHWFNMQSEQKRKLVHPKVITRDDYGWQEYVSFKECDSDADIDKYMYRLGSILFVSYLLGCTDLHVENIIAHGEYPVVIDTETMFFNAYSFQGMLMEKANGWEKMLSSSVFSSLLLPFDLVAKKKLDYVDISGILGGAITTNSKKIKTQVVINKGTDDIRFSEQEIEPNVGNTHNIPMYRGEKVNAGDYTEHLICGFSNAYMLLLNKKSDFLSFVASMDFSKGRFRQIFRNTNLYVRYLLSTYHPFYLSSSQERKNVYEHLKGKKGYTSKMHEEFVQLEIEQLMQDDVPCFYALYNSKAVFSAYGEKIQDFYSRTIEEHFLERIENLNHIDQYRQIYFIKCALATDSYSSHEFLELPKNICAFEKTEDNIQCIIKWIYDLREEYFRVPSKMNELWQYYCISQNSESRRLEVEPPDLYAGIGSTLFYIQLHRMYGQDDAQVAQMLVNELGNLFGSTVTNFSSTLTNVGLFTGAGSIVYLNYYAYKVYGDPRYLERMNRVCEEIIERIDGFECSADIVSGYAGLIVFSLNAWIKDKSLNRLFELAVCCGEKLYKIHCEKGIPLQSGLAHGYAGVSLAFIMLGTITEKQTLYALGTDLIAQERQLYCPATDTWTICGEAIDMNAWCYGAAGILVARTIALDYVSPADRLWIEADIQACLKRMLKDLNKPDDLDILCHGLVGNLDILLWYARKKHDYELNDVVTSVTANLVDRIKHHGVYYGNSANVPNISFMLGLTGLGYFFERFLDKTIPSVLAFEAFEEGAK